LGLHITEGNSLLLLQTQDNSEYISKGIGAVHH